MYRFGDLAQSSALLIVEARQPGSRFHLRGEGRKGGLNTPNRDLIRV